MELKEFQNEMECSKCGHASPDCKYHDIDSDGVPSEYLSWRCSRCGYYWKTEPKTKEVVDEPES